MRATGGTISGLFVATLALGSACSSEGGSAGTSMSEAGSFSGATGGATGGSPGTGAGGSGVIGGASAATGGASGSAGAGPGATGGSASGSGGSATGGQTGTADASSPPPDGIPEPNMSCTLVWESGFENGFPGEWSGYDNGSWSFDGTMPSGQVSAWTIIDRASGEPVFEGDHAYKGWITGAAADSHRPYPGIHDNAYQTPIVNTFWVYLDVDYDRLASGDWVHFGTWGNWTGAMGGTTGQWALHTMSVRDRLVEFAHTDPFLGEYIGPTPASEFPLRQWVRFTVYIHYEGSSGFVQAWQDGVPILRADVSQLATYPGDSLITAHWGMYAAATVDHGSQYNDAIRLWQLDGPLSDLMTEPLCGE